MTNEQAREAVRKWLAGGDGRELAEWVNRTVAHQIMVQLAMLQIRKSRTEIEDIFDDARLKVFERLKKDPEKPNMVIWEYVYSAIRSAKKDYTDRLSTKIAVYQCGYPGCEEILKEPGYCEKHGGPRKAGTIKDLGLNREYIRCKRKQCLAIKSDISMYKI